MTLSDTSPLTTLDAPGRGTYVSANPRALELAIKRKAFEMGFKQREVHVPVTLETMTRRVLRARLGEVLTSACDSAREVRALTDARGEEKPTLTEPVTADEWIEILANAQKRIVPDNWALIPRISGHIDADVNARLERSQLESAESHIGFGLSALTMDEIIASLDASGKDHEMVTNILGCLRKFRSTGDLSDAPVLVGIDGDVSFALRLAQLKFKRQRLHLQFLREHREHVNRRVQRLVVGHIAVGIVVVHRSERMLDARGGQDTDDLLQDIIWNRVTVEVKIFESRLARRELCSRNGTRLRQFVAARIESDERRVRMAQGAANESDAGVTEHVVANSQDLEILHLCYGLRDALCAFRLKVVAAQVENFKLGASLCDGHEKRSAHIRS
ncbi:hypothetical protein BE221DRAFT_203962 [Ostreococcus tauri]|uniref:Uncharacterized protein n=1 Tax=Ostreococcus tauri TaxID=70448 RepID=A0A1Y5IED3_OSTTA|nr:hypothetical protein BE221DRAFT_203962 [Ostreococcus tauri]